MYDAMLAETVTIRGDGGDEIEAYLARPMSQGPHGGVVVIHHMPGYDAPTKEIARTFAVHGYNAIMPNLYHRDAPGASPDDAAAAARAQGGVPDARLVGDVAGAAVYLRGLTSANGKVGVIGYCSGGRQAFLAACSLPLDAAVDCYGAFIVSPVPRACRSRSSPSSAWPPSCLARCSACLAPRTRTPRRRRQLSSPRRSTRPESRMSSIPTMAPGKPSLQWTGWRTVRRPRMMAGRRSGISTVPISPDVPDLRL